MSVHITSAQTPPTAPVAETRTPGTHCLLLPLASSHTTFSFAYCVPRPRHICCHLFLETRQAAARPARWYPWVAPSGSSPEAFPGHSFPGTLIFLLCLFSFSAQYSLELSHRLTELLPFMSASLRDCEFCEGREGPSILSTQGIHSPWQAAFLSLGAWLSIP